MAKEPLRRCRPLRDRARASADHARTDADVGEIRAEYGEEIVEDLSQQLQSHVGRGYSTTNLRYFRTFYLAYRERRPEIRHIGGGESQSDATPARARTIRHKRRGVSLAAIERAPLEGFSPLLGWSHYRALMKVEPAVDGGFSLRVRWGPDWLSGAS